MHVFACLRWGGFWIQVRVGCWYVAGIMFQRGWLGARSAKCSLAALHHSSVRIAHWKMQSKCINTQHMTFKMHHYATHATHENAIENCKTEIGKHLRKLQCVNAEYACRAIIRKQLPGFESCRLWRLSVMNISCGCNISERRHSCGEIWWWLSWGGSRHFNQETSLPQEAPEMSLWKVTFLTSC